MLIDKEREIMECISEPDIIQRGDVGTLLAIKKKVDRYLVVIYKEISYTTLLIFR